MCEHWAPSELFKSNDIIESFRKVVREVVMKIVSRQRDIIVMFSREESESRTLRVPSHLPIQLEHLTVVYSPTAPALLQHSDGPMK